MFFFIGFVDVFAGSVDSVLSFSAAFHYGYVIPHHTSIAYNITKPVNAAEFSILFKQKENQEYDLLYRYPDKGISYKYSSLGNNIIYGDAHSLSAFINFPYLQKESKFYGIWRMGFGAAWISKSWNIESNNENIAIGSKLNACFDIMTGINYKAGEKLTIYTNLNFTHYSNGNFNKPNLGINVLSSSFGINYSLSEQPWGEKRASSLKNKSWEYVFFSSFGFNGFNVRNPGPYPAYSLQLCAEKNVNMKRKFGGGIDLFYEEVYRYAFEEYEDRTDVKSSELIQTGLHGSYGLKYDKLEISLQIGVYLYAPYKMMPIYGRYALRYNIFERVMFSLGLKTHALVADFVEWGIGYRLGG
jgi:hypothetical protein